LLYTIIVNVISVTKQKEERKKTNEAEGIKKAEYGKRKHKKEVNDAKK